MAKLPQEKLNRLKKQDKKPGVSKPVSREIPESPKSDDRGMLEKIRSAMLGQGFKKELSSAWRGQSGPLQQWETIKQVAPPLRRAEQLVGLGAGTLASAVQEGFEKQHPYIGGYTGKWVPDIQDAPQAFKEFWDLTRQGELKAGIEAYQKAMPGGPGYWGAAELAGTAVLPMGLAKAGTGLIAKAPTLGGRGVQVGAELLGKGLRVPFQVEEAVTRGALGAVAAPFRKGAGILKKRFAYDYPSAPREGLGEGLGEAVESVDDLTLEQAADADALLDPATTPVTTASDEGAQQMRLFDGEDISDTERILGAPQQTDAGAQQMRLFDGDDVPITTTVADDVPLNTIVPDNQAGPILNKADPHPPDPKLDSTADEVFNVLQSQASPLELWAMKAPQFRDLLRRLDLIGRARGLVGMREMPHIYDPTKARPVNIIQTIMRLHEGAINYAQSEASRILRVGLREGHKGEAQLRELGVSITKGDRQVIKEASIDDMDKLYESLHDSSIPVAPKFRGLYNELKELAKFEEISRIDFDPKMARVQDYWYRGWKPSQEYIQAKNQGTIGMIPKFQKLRTNASYRTMRNAGFEPLSWNPFEQWRIARMQGVKYRQQTTLIWQLKKLGLWRPSSGAGDKVAGIIDRAADDQVWRTPKLGPAFEGKPFAIVDQVVDASGKETGEQMLKEFRGGEGVVHPEVAKRLEAMYGTMPKDWAKVGSVDMAKVVDNLVFIPKRAKLFGSFFQQVDFLFRNAFGTGMHVMDRLAAGKPLEAWDVGWRFPRSAYNIIKANLSPGFRQEMKVWLGSTKPLVKGTEEADYTRVTPAGLMKAGLSLFDFNIIPIDIDDIARSAADDVGMLGVKKVKNLIGQMESAMRRGLFDGVYPAAIMQDIMNNIAPQMVRKWGGVSKAGVRHYSDETINAAIVEFVNMKYSTLPKSQSVLQNRYFRGLFQRVFFSIGESEGLLRQGTNAITGPHAGMWRKHWLGAYVALMGIGNTIHLASTAMQGKPEALPWDRWVPISQDNWGPLPFSYRRDFAAPSIPWKGRGSVDLTMDIVGQADTVFRVLDPVSFLTSRESVPVRTLHNQMEGTDFYGAPITEVGPIDGIYSRTFAAINDMVAPIGIGQAALHIGREKIPGVSTLIPPGEERIGTTGQAIQALGLNVRAETTTQYRNRMARESGLINPETRQPVQTWEELLPGQEDQVERMFPEFKEELQRRTEIQAVRQQEYSIALEKKQKHEDNLVKIAKRLSEQYLEVPLTSGNYNPKSAREGLGLAENSYYGAVYGTIWSEEKGRFTGGIFDEDIQYEEPEDKTTVEHALWRYRKIYEDARDHDTGAIDFTGTSGTSGELLNKNLAQFWAGLTSGQVPQVINNIRLIEGNYSNQMQAMKDAGRYAGSVRLNFEGQAVGYYELEDHPRVAAYIAKEAGVGMPAIRRYLDKTFAERKASRNTPEGEAIGKALDKATRENGVLWRLRKLFIDNAPTEWRQAMLESGYGYQGKDKYEKQIVKQLREGKTLSRLNYERLYLNVLSR